LALEFHASIGRPGRLVVALNRWAVETVAHRIQVASGHAQIAEVLLHRCRAPVRKLEVVLVCAALVGVALQRQLGLSLLDAVGQGGQLPLRLGRQRGLVELEVDRLVAAGIRRLGDARAALALLAAGAIFISGAGAAGQAAIVHAPPAAGAIRIVGALVGALARLAPLTWAAVRIAGALGLGHALVALADEAGFAVLISRALDALSLNADLVVILALVVVVAFGIAGRTACE